MVKVKDTAWSIYVYSKTVFHLVPMDGRTTKKCLQIDISDLKESYEKGELSKYGWLSGGVNPADPLTKHFESSKTTLWYLKNEVIVVMNPIGWYAVEKTGLAWSVANYTREFISQIGQGRGLEERRTKENWTDTVTYTGRTRAERGDPQEGYLTWPR